MHKFVVLYNCSWWGMYSCYGCENYGDQNCFFVQGCKYVSFCCKVEHLNMEVNGNWLTGGARWSPLWPVEELHPFWPPRLTDISPLASVVVRPVRCSFVYLLRNSSLITETCTWSYNWTLLFSQDDEESGVWKLQKFRPFVMYETNAAERASGHHTVYVFTSRGRQTATSRELS